MLTFIQFINERMIDPFELAKRVSRRYGTKTKYGKWDKVEKGGSIPLKKYNAKSADSVFSKYDKHVKKHTGSYSPMKRDDKEWTVKRDALYRPAKHEISSLHPTQPYVRTNDHEILKNKIDNKNPDHIVTASHKGKNYILDGHHAVMAASMRGDKHVNSKHMDLD